MPTFIFVFLFTVIHGPHANHAARVRPNPFLQSVLADASGRSPLLAAIVGAIDASDIIVHLTCEHFTVSSLEGRTMWVSGNRDARYLRVQIDCLLPHTRLVAILAHELQHVAEVASAREVVDERS